MRTRDWILLALGEARTNNAVVSLQGSGGDVAAYPDGSAHECEFSTDPPEWRAKVYGPPRSMAWDYVKMRKAQIERECKLIVKRHTRLLSGPKL